MKIRGDWGRKLKKMGLPAFSFAKSVIDFIYPPLCFLCQNRLEEKERFICFACWEGLEILPQPFCTSQEYLRKVVGKVWFSASIAFYQYSPAVQRLIHQMKYQRMGSVANIFALVMGRRLKEVIGTIPVDYIVPIPLHYTRERERGYNQAKLLAVRISRESGIPLLENCIKRRRYTTQQAKLDKNKRYQNVRDAFCVKNAELIKDRTILLTDDVLTTGNTMNECARMLSCAGAREIIALTIVRV